MAAENKPQLLYLYTAYQQFLWKTFQRQVGVLRNHSPDAGMRSSEAERKQLVRPLELPVPQCRCQKDDHDSNDKRPFCEEGGRRRFFVLDLLTKWAEIEHIEGGQRRK